MIGSATRVAAVIGHPVRHSLSPIVHGAAFDALALDWAYAAFDVEPGRAVDAVSAMRTLSLGGLSVTMPHKQAAQAGCDRLTARARAVDAINTVFWDGDELVGDATDGPGLVGALADAGVEIAQTRVAVVGAGGAARAVIAALGAAGAAEVRVVARRPEAAEAAAALVAAAAVGSETDVGAAAIVVNATPVGMDGTEAAGHLPVPSDALRAGQVVVDLVYHPVDTPMLIAARKVGARAVDGVSVLVHQAAVQFENWTGLRAPVGVMEAAARTALYGPPV